jgi:hypothetical protein
MLLTLMHINYIKINNIANMSYKKLNKILFNQNRSNTFSISLLNIAIKVDEIKESIKFLKLILELVSVKRSI